MTETDGRTVPVTYVLEAAGTLTATESGESYVLELEGVEAVDWRTEEDTPSSSGRDPLTTFVDHDWAAFGDAPTGTLTVADAATDGAVLRARLSAPRYEAATGTFAVDAAPVAASDSEGAATEATPESFDRARLVVPGARYPVRGDAVVKPAAALAGADLSDADLGGVDLSGATLSAADLSGASFSAADLSGADLRESDLRNAALDGASLDGADLRGATLNSADLAGASLRDADLRNVQAVLTVFDGVDGRGADFRNAHLHGAKFREGDFRGADFRETYLHHVYFDEADLRGADFRDADIYHFEAAGANVEDADFEDSVFRTEEEF
jgi:uncharacterized protein YjbI with pentapeptide repeats